MTDHFRYTASDPTDPRFQALAFVDSGELVLCIQTQLPTGERSRVFRGEDQFRRIVTHFAGRFRSIRDTWISGDNLKEFNRAIGAGVSHDNAAVMTGTGTQAAAAGYSSVKIVSLEGLPGRYTKVVLSFSRQE